MTVKNPNSKKAPTDHSQDAQSQLPAELRAFKFHPLALKLPPLSKSQLEKLVDDIVTPCGINLRARITIAPDGRILDGRHRTIALVRGGVEDELRAQIGNRQGEWVEVLAEGQDELEFIASAQLNRRNCSKSRMAVALLDAYNKAAERGRKLSGAASASQRKIRSVDEFCKRVGIGKSTFKNMRELKSKATPDQWDRLDKGEITVNELKKELGSHDQSSTSCGSSAKTAGNSYPDFNADSATKHQSNPENKRGASKHRHTVAKSLAGASGPQYTAELLNETLRSLSATAKKDWLRDFIDSLDNDIRRMLVNDASRPTKKRRKREIAAGKTTTDTTRKLPRPDLRKSSKKLTELQKHT